MDSVYLIHDTSENEFYVIDLAKLGERRAQVISNYVESDNIICKCWDIIRLNDFIDFPKFLRELDPLDTSDIASIQTSTGTVKLVVMSRCDQCC